jgi:cyanophycinase
MRRPWVSICLTFLLLVAGALPDEVKVTPSGALVLCGGGKLPEKARSRFVELAGGPRAVIVVIPTASRDADVPEQRDSFLSPWRRWQEAQVLWLHTRERQQADTADFCAPLATATGVWISGGDQSRLRTAYGGTLTERAIRDVIRRGGVVGGTSAGAAILGQPMIIAGQEQPECAPGFGLLRETIVDQHFTQRQRAARLRLALERYPSAQGLGIDEDTAVVIRAGTLEVFGSGGVCLYWRDRPGGPLREQYVKSAETIPYHWPSEP